MARRELLQLLADGEFHSGQELARVMGISRTAVWKQLGRLDATGLSVESVKGAGYRLLGGIELLDERRICRELDSSAAGLLSELVVADDIDSTNAEVLRRFESGTAQSGFVCTAERQTAGRGRRGRSWISPYGHNIYVSLAWGFDGGAAALEGLSLAVAVAVSEALAAVGVKDLSLKWPNDLLLNGAKLGGILIEMVGDIQARCDVVVGVGVNVSMSQRAAEGIDQPWTDLAGTMPESAVSRNQLLAGVINRLLPLLAGYENQGFAPWRERWMRLDAFVDTPVLIASGSGKMAGVARGIDASGALLLETEQGTRTIHGGEVSVRPSA